MRRRLLPLITAACVLLGILADPVGAVSDSIYQEYLETGSISGCVHSEAELQTALTSVPADIQAYDPGFPQALNLALDRRAAGCVKKAAPNINPAASGGTVLATDGSPGPPGTGGLPLRPLPKVSGASDFPVEAIYLVIVIAALLGAAVALVPRRPGPPSPGGAEGS